ncbi:uncharacterized protein N7529_009100 [Penicillium soppii]|uniref:uncharacterized protein n=1 Tax=Penicillium soppii TaxID=69789 RepID=UPI00254946D7|nr:uncharacterized protein N7529_009100 [Penicillium soppii]KAJ5861790.1 hypothetical protein N7529_009100 [Penicillium soppii]
MFNWFKLNSKKDPKEGSWNPNTMTLEMQQPTSPVAPSTERVVIEQANSYKWNSVVVVVPVAESVPVCSALSAASAAAKRKVHDLCLASRRLSPI